jgi:hypothetical protein
MATNAVARQDCSQGEQQFPSAEFVRKLHVLQGKQKELKDALKRVERKLQLTKTKETINEFERKGLDVLGEIRTLEGEQRRLESAIPGAKGDIQELFSAESKRYGVLKNKLWSRCLEEIVQPYVKKLKGLLESLREVLHAMSADADGAVLGDIDVLESQRKTFNEFAKQNGVGLNLLIPTSPTDSLRWNVSQVMKENLLRFLGEPICAQLRELLSMTKGKA